MHETGSSPVVCRLAGVVKDYPGQRALELDELELRAGEVHALVGQNGAGKSTLVRILAGATHPSAGSIVLDGTPVRFASPADASRAGVASVFQELAVVANASVLENANLGVAPPRLGPFVNWRAMRARTLPMAERVGLRPDDLDRPAKSLSVADLQLVAICRGLLHRARLVLLDEPTAALTEREVQRLYEIIGDLTRGGAAVLYISHRLEEVAGIAQRITVLRDGRRVATVAPQTPRRELVRLMTGGIEERQAAERAAAPASGEVLVTVDQLQGRTTTAASFEIHRGEILGLAGLVGSGRTALARVLVGLDPRAGGTLALGGQPVRLADARDAVRGGIVFVPEDRRRLGLVIGQSVGFNVTLASLRRFLRLGFWIDGRRERAGASEFIARLAIRCRGIGQPVRQLSGGNQQKVVLARWMLRGARLLVVDEPTVGLDVAARAEVHAILRGLAEDGVAILFISSDFDELCAVVDRALVMREGQVVAELGGTDLTKTAILDHCYRVAEEVA